MDGGIEQSWIASTNAPPPFLICEVEGKWLHKEQHFMDQNIWMELHG